MARSRKRTITGETTRIYRPKRPPKIKKRSIWPFILLAIIIVITAYYVWDTVLERPDISFDFFNNDVAESELNASGKAVDSTQLEMKTNVQKNESVSENIPAAKETTTNKRKATTPEKSNKIPYTDIPPPVQRNIQVEILNGCGVKGLASTFAKVMRKKGIDVVKTGNYRSSGVKNTQVIDRIGNKEFATQIGELLGINSRHIYTQKKPELLIDATIILGKDYKQLKN